MRKLRNRQLELGEIRIEDIKLNLKSRDGVQNLGITFESAQLICLDLDSL